MSKPRLKVSQAPNQGSKIKAHDAPNEGSTNKLKPIFNLEYLSGAYCLTLCDQEQSAAFALALHKLSRLTWQEIQHAPRHGLGSETISRDSIKNQKYPDELTDDIKLLAFRFCAKASMVGYRIGRVFTVLFLDRDFTLYDHG